MKTDVQIINAGSIMQFFLLTRKAKKWVSENVQAESWQWMGNSLYVDQRYAGELASGMQSNGLNVK